MQTVHNLEHGGVVIHYGPDVPKSEVDKIREWYSEDPNGLVISPLSSNKDKVTLSAWTAPDAASGTRDRGRGWLATGTKFDKARVRRVHRGASVQGPRAAPARAVSTRQLAIHPPGWRNWQTRST